jgi:hypothetical protein
MKKKKIKHDVAKNGQEAVQKWRSGVFHLILVSHSPASGPDSSLMAVDLDGYPNACDGRDSSH